LKQSQKNQKYEKEKHVEKRLPTESLRKVGSLISCNASGPQMQL